MRIDGVFSGGGVKAFAFLGALEEVEKANYSFDRVAGTSAGAILAGFIAAGYTSKEIETMFKEINIESFMDPVRGAKMFPFMKWFLLYFTMGMHRGVVLEEWMYVKLAQRGIYTFKDLPRGSLKVIASDLTLGRMVVIPDDLQRLYGIHPDNFLIAKAIRMSAGIPYFFVPVKIPNQKGSKSIVVDGALLSNFPIWVFGEEKELRTRPVLGMKLSDSLKRINPHKIKNALSLSRAVLETMMRAHDARYISKEHTSDIMFIPVKEIEAIDFTMNQETRLNLIQLGRKHAQLFLKQWPS